MIKRLLHLSFAMFLGGAIALLMLTATTPALATPATIRQVDCATGTDAGDCTGSACATIQYAIDQSTSGDTIQVAAGTCSEHLTMKNGVSVHGQGWLSTIIDGGYSGGGAVVYFPSSVAAGTVLSGVQVTGGGTGEPSTSPNGGGMSVYGAPSIINTFVYSCTGYYGGGVYVNGGAPTFDNVPVWNNTALYGGGFYLFNNATVNMFSDLAGTNGTIWFNTATSQGGAIHMSGVTATLAGLRIYWNSSTGNGGGIYIESTPNQVTLLLNDISGNQANNNGGGVFAAEAGDIQMGLNVVGSNIIGGNTSTGGDGGGAFFNQCNGLVALNQFYGNNATSGSGGGAAVWFTSTNLSLASNWLTYNGSLGGGGLYLQTGADPLVNSNVIAYNTASTGGGISTYQAGVARVTNNIIVHNTSGGLGGGVQIGASPIELVNNTIADNTGDGVIFSQAEGVVIVNNIISGNSGDGIDRSGSDTTNYTANYNDVYNNGTPYNNVPPAAHPNDLSVDPQFVASGDLFQYYHIQPTSPVAATGLNFAAMPAQDIDGELRVMGGSVSMGVDELTVPVYTAYLPMVVKN